MDDVAAGILYLKSVTHDEFEPLVDYKTYITGGYPSIKLSPCADGTLRSRGWVVSHDPSHHLSGGKDRGKRRIRMGGRVPSVLGGSCMLGIPHQQRL